MGLPLWLSSEAFASNAGDTEASGLIPEGGNGNPLHYSCLGNPVDREAGGLPCVGSQRAGHDGATEKNVFSLLCTSSETCKKCNCAKAHILIKIQICPTLNRTSGHCTIF